MVGRNPRYLSRIRYISESINLIKKMKISNKKCHKFNKQISNKNDKIYLTKFKKKLLYQILINKSITKKSIIFLKLHKITQKRLYLLLASESQFAFGLDEEVEKRMISIRQYLLLDYIRHFSTSDIADFGFHELFIGDNEIP